MLAANSGGCRRIGLRGDPVRFGRHAGRHDLKRRPLSADFVLQEFLPYLTNRAGVKTGLVFSDDLRGFGVTLFEWRILIALWGNQDIRLNDVADIITADLSTTSRQVRRLERAGLIARGRADTDRRALRLMLTAKGHDLTSKIIPVARMHEHVATTGLEADDLAILRRALVTIINNLAEFETRRGSAGSRKAAEEIEADGS